MVGLVVVSHSRALAYAAVALANEMVHDRPVRIEVAAGLDETTLGTDAAAIAAAIARARGDSGDGVVVLMDLGSAVLSAELALELVEGGSDRVVLCPAPFVEGLVAAAVTAASGADPHEVAAEAAAALKGKQAHLAATTETTSEITGVGPSRTFTVADAHGLHARPAARLVSAVRRFDARVEMRNRTTGSPWVPASSLSRVATLGALHGHEVDIRASGRQAREAVDQIVAMGARASNGNETDATPASPGIGIGPAWQPHTTPLEIPDVPAQDIAAERRQLDEALATVRKDLEEMRRADPALFDAHLLLLDDPELLDDVRTRIENHSSAPRAWQEAVDRVAAAFDGLPDPYLRARAADVRSVAEQVLRALLGAAAPTMAVGEGVLIAPDLSPADAAQLDPERVAGVLLAFGSPLSHAAIIARTRGIPAVVGLGPAVLHVPEGTLVALDGGTGEVAIAPDEVVLGSFRNRAHKRNRARRTEAVTKDGTPIAVGANIGSILDARVAAEHGADMAGLVRTELLFLDRTEAPDVDEQETTYRAIAEALGGRRITIRTLDIGADKQLSYLPRTSERGIRHSLKHRQLFTDQLTAIGRAAIHTPVSVMFPMVTTVDEFLDARSMLDDVEGLRVGIMVEVPAAALKAAAFAKHVDFFSIGTNDLTQYALAADRGTTPGDAMDPGVLRLIDAVCRGAGRIPVSVCGELAGDETAVPVLTGLGVRELSVVPLAVPVIKEAVRAVDLKRAAPTAAQALELDDASAVRSLLA
jgi:phosphoenolpyruvate-protein phosphotransferase/dihydroxyacetone kinase phosphotransfer subunit